MCVRGCVCGVLCGECVECDDVFEGVVEWGE